MPPAPAPPRFGRGLRRAGPGDRRRPPRLAHARAVRPDHPLVRTGCAPAPATRCGCSAGFPASAADCTATAVLRRVHGARRRADRAAPPGHAAARAGRRARSGPSPPATCTRSSTTASDPAVSLHVYFPGLTIDARIPRPCARADGRRRRPRRARRGLPDGRGARAGSAHHARRDDHSPGTPPAETLSACSASWFWPEASVVPASCAG